MKIKQESYYAFYMPEVDKKFFSDTFVNEALYRVDKEALELRRYFASRYMSDTEKVYLYTRPAQELIHNIKVSNNSELRKMIIDAADREATILFNKKEFCRYFRLDDDIICAYFKLGADYYLNYEAFRIREDEIIHPKGMVPVIEYFIKCLVFAKCTNTETEILNGSPGEANRKMKFHGEKYYNESGISVIVVNAKYNKFVMRNEAFYVNSHGRFQRCGPGLSEIKYIIIEGFYKKGYKRGYK